MPVTIKVIRTQDFMRAKADGVLDVAASRDLLKKLTAESKAAGIDNLLVDTREAEVRLSTADRFELGAAVASELPAARAKVALLVPRQEQVDARFLETVSRNRGANLGAFADFEAAITWLILEEQP
jgi:hypothetical protein